LLINGKYQERILPPFIPGGEFSGIVLEVADDVEQFSAGMRVMGSVQSGAFAEEVIGSSELLWEIPEKMTFEEAASFLVAYATAFMGLIRRAKLKKGYLVAIL